MALLRILSVSVLIFATAAGAEAKASGGRINEIYPGLTSGGLAFALPGDLPQGVLLKAKDIEITSAQLDEELAKAPAEVAEQLQTNKLLVLESLATRMLLVQCAKEAQQGQATGDTPEKELIQGYLEHVVADVQATDDEVAAFYAENKEMCGGASLDQMKDQLKAYVLDEKKQKAVVEHIRTLGERIPITVAATWLAEQAKLAQDNPVDKARASGLPTMVDFGASGCRPCELMAPILETLKKKYEGKANVLFVHVREQQILASRYGIRSIPVQVFFDKQGKETSRHVGFYPQAEIEKKLADLGVQ